MTWSLAYAHDENGQRTDGKKDDLIESVLNGQSVRFLLNIDDYQYVTDAECLWVWRDNVYAQNTSHVSMDFFEKSANGLRRVTPNEERMASPMEVEHVIRFQEASYSWMLIADTQGYLEMIRWSVGDHEMRGHDQQRVSAKWFVG